MNVHFLCLSSRDLQNRQFALLTVSERPTLIWLKDTSLGYGATEKVSDLNSFVEMPCLTNSENLPLFVSRDCHLTWYQSNQKRLGNIFICHMFD